MATTWDSRDEDETNDRTSKGFFHRSLSPASFERLRNEHSDYFYKPKRGPSMCKNNITITRPIKTFETVSKLVELLSQGNKKTHVEESESSSSPTLSKKFDDQKSSSHYSSFLSMDGENSSSRNSSAFSSRSNSSISTVAEQDTQVIIIDEPLSPTNKTQSDYELTKIPSCHTPAIGLNITSCSVHLVLLELYPQNVDYSTIIFQRYLISLILDYEHQNWGILNVDLHTITDQEGNFRLFTLSHKEFDLILLRLESFIRYNSSLASSFILNIALTGEQTNDYEMKISNHLSKINLNFDIIQYRAETYMIGLDFFRQQQNNIHEQDEELFEILTTKKSHEQQLYPYLLVHAEVASTFFYIVHSPTKYSVITTNNLSYKTYANLFQCLQPGYNLQHDEQSSNSIRRMPPISFDFTRENLCKHCHHSPINYSLELPLTSFTRLTSRYLPIDYSKSTKSHYIYRGWSNRRTSPIDSNITNYDVHTQTDDSYLESSSMQTRLAMRRSLLSMLTMNFALNIQLIAKLYPSVQTCVLAGEFFQLENQSGYEITKILQTMLGDQCPLICQLKRESLISALGCALPRIYFDVLNEQNILGNDCIS